MKKLLGIVVLGFLLSGNAYAEKIHLKCFYPKNGILDSLTFNTDTKKVFFKGISIRNYILEDDVFKFFFDIQDYTYRVSLNRNTGILSAESFKLTKEELARLSKKIAKKVKSDNNSDIYDLEFQTKLFYEELGKYERVFEIASAECEKTDKKF